MNDSEIQQAGLSDFMNKARFQTTSERNNANFSGPTVNKGDYYIISEPNTVGGYVRVIYWNYEENSWWQYEYGLLKDYYSGQYSVVSYNNVARLENADLSYSPCDATTLNDCSYIRED